MIGIAVCDDDKFATSEIEDKIYAISKKINLRVEIDVFFDGQTFIDYMLVHNKRYDIAFIDIEMNGKDGIEAAKQIRTFDKEMLIIYVTNYESYALDAFEVSTFRFITKPVEDAQFEKYYLSAIREIIKVPVSFRFQFKKIHYKVRIDDIIYFQSEKRITYINCRTKMHKCYEKLNTIERIMTDCGVIFFRIHQSFLINPRYIEMYMYDTIQLIDGTVLSVSENRRKKTNELYCHIMGESIIV